MDHRVEPPAWLPQGAAPEAADPEADDSTAAEDAQTSRGQQRSTGRGPAEEFANGNGNGHDSSFTYSRDDSYHYGEDVAVRRGHQLPKPVHAARRRPAPAMSPTSRPRRRTGCRAATWPTATTRPETGPAGHDLPASGLSEGGLASDALPGNDLPASGLGDPAMPDTGFASRRVRASAARGQLHRPRPRPGTPTRPGRLRRHDPGQLRRHGRGDLQRPRRLPYPARRAAGGRGRPVSQYLRSAARAPPPVSSARRSGQRPPPPVASVQPCAPASSGARPGSPAAGVGEEPPGQLAARKANLVISRVEPWSVMKFSFLISLVAVDRAVRRRGPALLRAVQPRRLRRAAADPGQRHLQPDLGRRRPDQVDLGDRGSWATPCCSARSTSS